MFKFFVLVLCLATDRGMAQPVNAPADANPIPVAELAQGSLVDIWFTLDGLDFWDVPTETPDGYYSDVDTSSTDGLRATLHQLIDDHEVLPYSHRSRPGQGGHRIDTWDVIALADAHPDDPSAVIDLYLNGRFVRQLAGTETDPRYDREHAWPKSLGFPDDRASNAAYSDCHHLFAAYRSYNGSRSNKPYAASDDDPAYGKPTIEGAGRGGSLSDEPDTHNYSPPGGWETWLGRRGDVARAMFYMDLRYEGDTNEPDLRLTHDEGLIIKRDVWRSGGVAYMGLLPTLLEWHAEDPVDDLERRRNNVVYLFQRNRNPFIDHPQWVEALFGNGGDVLLDPMADGAGALPWVNEIHYDNDGEDVDEFVEIAGPSGLVLDGWRLVGYNGNGGRVYRTIDLAGTLEDSGDGIGFAVIRFEGLQNGGPDGLALIAPDGHVVEFLSYEGTFTATGGPAEGMVSDDIGVAETGATPVGHSLQYTGGSPRSISTPEPSRWVPPSPMSPGSTNPSLSFR